VQGAELMTKVGCGGHQVSLVGEWTRGERISVVFVCEGRLQPEVKPKGLVKIMEQIRGCHSDQATHSSDINRANLLCLGFGLTVKSSAQRWQVDLKRIDPIDVRTHWNDGDHASAKALCGSVGAVVADDDRRSRFVCLATHRRVEVNKVNLSAKH
jgi:hypothetical protein